MAWRDISSAPKDNTPQLLAWETGPGPLDWSMGVYAYLNGSWFKVLSEHGRGSPIAYRPTHWQDDFSFSAPPEQENGK